MRSHDRIPFFMAEYELKRRVWQSSFHCQPNGWCYPVESGKRTIQAGEKQMIPTYSGEMPYLTTEQMIEVDRAMMEDYTIGLIQMMENAGRNLAHLARERFFEGDPQGKQVIILAGTGGNGGGALVCARRLHNYGVQVQVYLSKADEAFKWAIFSPKTISSGCHYE